MVEVDSCFFLPLIVAAYIIGAFDIIRSACVFCFCCNTFYKFGWRVDRCITFITGVIYLVIGILLILGTKNRIAEYVLVWVVFSSICIAVLIGLMFWNLLEASGLYVFCSVLQIVINIYLIICMASLYQKLQRGDKL